MPSIHSSWAIAAGCLAALIPLLAVFYGSVQPFDPAAGGADVAFALPATTVASASPSASPAAGPSSSVGTSDPGTSDAALAVSTTIGSTTTAAPIATAPVLPRDVVIVGDSQAHSLAINLPSGIESTFDITDGSIDGCGVYDEGKGVSSRPGGFTRSFGECGGWAEEWASSASGADVALVVLGAWEVLDLEIGGQPVPFGSAEADRRFLEQVNEGVDALLSTGAQVALLEVACMRPQDVKGAGVPALPERGDDARVAHLNELLRQVAAARPTGVTFLPGPAAWCSDPAISSDLGYRWDGVHVYKPGAKLIYETIAPGLLSIPVPA